MALGLGSPIPPSYPNDLPLPGVGGYERAEGGQSDVGDPMAAVLRGLGASVGQKNNKAFHLFLMSLANAAFAKSRDGPPTVGTTTPPTSTMTSTTTSTTTWTSTRTTATTTTTPAPPPPCRLSDWGTWSSCGGAGPDCRGRRTRLRSFTQWSVAGCRGLRLQEFQGCQVPGCQCSWGAWDDCKGSCGQGTRRRQRLCGTGSEEERCWLGPCATSCSLTQWSGWSSCEGWGPECRGSRTRRRNFETLSAGGCDERLEERKDCRDSSCVCGWESWGPCQGGCGSGRRERQRLCGRGTQSDNCWLQPCVGFRINGTSHIGFSINGRSHIYVASKMNGNKAQAYCASLGWDLASEYDASSLRELKAALPSSASSVHLHGGAAGSSTPSAQNYFWRSGPWAKLKSLSRIDASLWRPGEPDGKEAKSQCVELFRASGNLGDLDCGAERPFVCAQVSPPALPGFDIDGKRHLFVGTRLDMKGRVEYCVSLGMQLAAPTSLASLTALAKALKNTGVAFVALYGGVLRGSEPKLTNYRWFSGPFDNARTLKFIARNLWGPGEPNDNEMCVELDLATARLSDSSCGGTPFVCAQHPSPPLSGFAIDGKRHAFFASRKKAYEAQEHCASLGWDLASFDSAESLAELRSALSGTAARSVIFSGSVVNNNVHSLRNFKRHSGPWKSSKMLGPIDTSLWGPGEPDGKEDGHKCVEVNLVTARLNDIDCGWPRPFVCVDRG